MRYRWKDHFWFSFFHEGGHVYLHGKRRAFVDLPAGPDEGAVPDGEYEAEANRFAQDILIPPSEAASLSGLENRSDIIDFAQRLGIPPGVVVGRMQREAYLPWHVNNDLRRRFVLVEE